jgi:catechol 2,3-dioxygenase-like lactoylglutathione lyase family enzyme
VEVQPGAEEARMKLRLHHINLSTEKVEEMDAFYRDVLGLETATSDLPGLRGDAEVYDGDVAFLDDGHMHLHVARKDVQAGFRTGQIVNPVSHGHVAYRCDDIEAFKRHLEARGLAYSDWGESAVKGWHQVYFYDPDGNVIEVHQVVG